MNFFFGEDTLDSNLKILIDEINKLYISSNEFDTNILKRIKMWEDSNLITNSQHNLLKKSLIVNNNTSNYNELIILRKLLNDFEDNLICNSQ